jgi:hypothetical protein
MVFASMHKPIQEEMIFIIIADLILLNIMIKLSILNDYHSIMKYIFYEDNLVTTLLDIELIT